MKLTVITSTYNCGEKIQETANSLRSQTHSDIEWIIVDGGSNSSTIENLEKCLDVCRILISEPDDGIYDAWNKACKHVGGDYVIFLGAGDVFHDSNVVARICEKIHEHPNYLMYCGNVSIVDSNKDVILTLFARDSYASDREFKAPPHPGVISSVELLRSNTPFDKSYKIAGDQKFMVPVLASQKALMLDLEISLMDNAGVSNDYKNVFVVNREMNRVRRELGYKISVANLLQGYVDASMRYLAHKLIPIFVIRGMKRGIKSGKRQQAR